MDGGQGEAPHGRSPRRFVVLGFRTTHDALAAEQLLLGYEIPVTPIPTPVSLGAMCGIALRIEPGDGDRAAQLLAEHGIAVESQGEIMDV